MVSEGSPIANFQTRRLLGLCQKFSWPSARCHVRIHSMGCPVAFAFEASGSVASCCGSCDARM